jgi:tellurite resistance protein
MVGKRLGLLGGVFNKVKGNTDILEGFCAVVVRVGSADGKFDQSEEEKGLSAIHSLKVIQENFTPQQIDKAFDKQAARAKTGRSGRRELLTEIQEAAAKGGADIAKAMIVLGLDVADDNGIGEQEDKELRFLASEIRVDYERCLQEG